MKNSGQNDSNSNLKFGNTSVHCKIKNRESGFDGQN